MAVDPAARASPASTPSTIKLSITFGPPGAVAKLDGVPLTGSPFVAQAPRDGSMHRIDVEGPGLTPRTTTHGELRRRRRHARVVSLAPRTPAGSARRRRS